MSEHAIFQYVIFDILQEEVCAEYRFHPQRRWRFDFAVPALKIAVEIEGGAWVHGRHNRGKGYINDMEKYNHAQLLGWKVFRFTPSQIDECAKIMTMLKK
jgi:very-short-patch-repair endonuclease